MNRLFATLSLLTLAGLFSGCSLVVDSQTTCAADSDCTGGAVCQDGLCVKQPAVVPDAGPTDTDPPAVTITESPLSVIRESSARFAFEADEPDCTFECSLDAAAYAACTSPQSYTGLTDGPHTFQVRATDAAGNRGDAASHPWTVDAAPPETTLGQPQPTDPSNADAVSFSFTCSEASCTFECQLDAAGFAPCTSPKAYAPLAEGVHTFEVRATDVAGNHELEPAAFTWHVDLTPPTTQFDGAVPPTRTRFAVADFAFLASEEATFECQLDGAGFNACTSPMQLGSLAEGPHVFEVRATDRAGNVESPALSHSWTVDQTAPSTSLLGAAPPARTRLTTASIGFACNEAGCTFECALDGAAFADCASPAALSGLLEGLHQFQVRATDGAGNVDLTPLSVSWTVDQTPPDTVITSPPPSNPSNAANVTFAFDCVGETGCTFECALDGAPFAACTSPHTLTNLAEGARSFAVRAIDAAGNPDTSPSTHGWTVDRTGPETTFTSALPANPTNVDAASFGFQSSEPGSSFECALDGAAFAPCTSPHALTGLADASHTFQVRAIDPAGNRDLTPASHTWRVDLTAPETAMGTGPAANTRNTSASLTFSSPDTGATFECALDGAPFAACTSPRALSGLAQGDHRFEVRARDAAGNVDPTPAFHAWTVDLTPPVTVFTAQPEAVINVTYTTVEFTSDAGATFECSLDGAAFGACSGPGTYTVVGLTEASHTIRVRATDLAGNVETTPASVTFRVDLSVPDTTITAGMASPTQATSGSFSFTADKPGSTFECKLDTAAWAACTSPYAVSGLTEGSHTFAVRAIDPAGNIDPAPATRTIVVDLTRPDTTLSDAGRPAPLTNQTTAIFQFSCNESNCTFECMLDGRSWTACTSPHTVFSIPAGARTFSVRATDAAGWLDQSPATYSWTVDLVEPETTLAVAGRPPAMTNLTTATFSFSSEAGATFECKVDAQAWTLCTSPNTVPGLAEGPHSFYVRAKDVAGNVDSTPPSHSWTVDLTRPNTAILTGPASTTNQTSATFTFSSEASATFECRLDTGSWLACTSPQGYTVVEGAHTFSVRATDAAGNVDDTPASQSWTVDLAPPATTLAASPRPAARTRDTNASFSFSSETGATFECQLDAGAFTACSSPFTRTGLAEGSHTFSVRARDTAGNFDPTPESHTWTIDLTPPETTLATAGRPPNPTNQTTASFTFTSEAGATFECQTDGGAWTACTSPRALSGLTAGSHSFTVRATDDVGNLETTPESYTWMIDLTPPETTLAGASLPPSVTNLTTAAFTFSSEAGATFECLLDTGSWESCASPKSYTVTAGAHAFQVRAVDTAGNLDPSPAIHNWTVDLMPPETTLASAGLPPARTRTTSATFTFSSEAGATFECKLDLEAFAACTSPVTRSGFAEGSHTFSVRARDTAGNVDQTPEAHTWTVDLTPPETTLAGAGRPPGVTNQTSATFSFTSEAGATFQCQLDGGAWASCTSPYTVSGLLAGNRSFAVRASDDVGNVETTPETYAWTIDLTPPETSLSNTGLPPAVTNQTAYTFTFTSEAGATFECQHDGGAWTACTSPHAFTAVEGARSFAVRAIDTAGNADPTPSSTSWTVDLTPPETSLTSAGLPPTRTRETTATFAFTSESGATFECKLDLEGFAACASPVTRSGLTEGSHTFSVRARDVAGNVDATPEAHTWTVDLTPPETTLAAAGRPPVRTNQTSATFTFTSEAGATFQCQNDLGAWASCTSPHSLSGLAPGNRTFAVRAIDGVGNVETTPEAYAWVIDLTAPETTFVGALPPSPSGSSSATFDFTCDEAGTGCTFECSLDGAAFAACTAPAAPGSLADGPHSFEVRARDAAGNVDATPASHSWTVDADPPDTNISSGPSAPTRQTSATFVFNADESGCTFECQLDGGAATTCSSPHTFSGLAEGPHQVAIAAIDPAGNRDATPATRSWSVDTTGPDTAFSGALPANPTNQTAASFSFDCGAEPGCTFECSFDGAAFAACSSPQNLTGLSEADHTFAVRALDALGNADSTPASHTWTVDLTGPVTTITSGPAHATADTSATFAFTSELGATFTCGLDTGTLTACTSPFNSTIELTPGPHYFLVRGRDAVGNQEAAAVRYDWWVGEGFAASSVSAGASYSCAVNGSAPAGEPDVLCWGADPVGGTDLHAAQGVAGLPDTAFIRVEVGAGRACALTVDRAVWCWGPLPPAPIALPDLATDLGVGGGFACAIVAGEVYCWGEGSLGQLGDGLGLDSAVPVRVALTAPAQASALAVGSRHACAATGVGQTLYCWGDNADLQLANAFVPNSLSPIPVGLGGVSLAAAGDGHTCAAGASGGMGVPFLKCWGRNASGQLGDGAFVSSPIPVDVVDRTQPTTVLTAGWDHTCAIAGGVLTCWGDNTAGQIGDGTLVSVPKPVAVLNLGAVDEVDGGDQHTCARTLTTAWCWGEGKVGQLGNAEDSVSEPSLVVGSK